MGHFISFSIRIPKTICTLKKSPEVIFKVKTLGIFPKGSFCSKVCVALQINKQEKLFHGNQRVAMPKHALKLYAGKHVGKSLHRRRDFMVFFFL